LFIDQLNCSENEILSLIRESDCSSKVGFEREGLRVGNSLLSKKPHPKSLGSALCNKFITTDFSEAQLELVTPPHEDKKDAMQFLDDIHHFTSHKIEDEIIWPFSMPLDIGSDEDIPIASYGKSNLARFKEIYRNGLSERYGKMMQAISGVHYNYSVPDAIWENELFKNIDIDPKETRSAAYFNMMRNIYRMNWLVFYLFGASPVITKNFLTQDSEPFKKLDKQTLYLPYSTSLRMSNFGYQNARRKKLEVSINSMAQYISDLKKATNTTHEEFRNIQTKNSNLQAQINENILQIDDEYYAIARAKSKIISDQQTTSKLNQGGVDFIELRSLDIDPFSRTGINEETTLFLELLLTYCFIKQGQLFTSEEIENINHNDSLVAKTGRKPNLELIRNRKKISLSAWGNQIMENLYPIAAILDCEGAKYSIAIENAKEKINNPDQTLSAQILELLSSNNTSFLELGMSIGRENKDYYLKSKKSTNQSWDLLDKEAKESIAEQEALEKNDSLSFESYIENYFKL